MTNNDLSTTVEVGSDRFHDRSRNANSSRNSLEVNPHRQPLQLSPNSSDCLGSTPGDREETHFLEPASNDDVPHFHEGMVKFTFLMQGIGFQLPWNAYISATEYFETRLCSSSSTSTGGDADGTVTNKFGDSEATFTFTNILLGKKGGRDGNNFMLWFGLLFNLSYVITLGMMLIIQRRRDKNGTKRSSSTSSIEANFVVDELSQSLLDGSDRNGSNSVVDDSSRKTGSNKEIWYMIVGSFSTFLITMIVTTILVLIPSIDPSIIEFVTLTSAVIFGVFGAYNSAGLVSFANIFPPNLGIQPFVTGQAVGAVAISILNVVLSSMEKNGARAFWDENCSNMFVDDGVVIRELIHVDINSEDGGRINATPTSVCPDYSVDWGAFTYFLIGCVLNLLCIGLFIYLDQHPITSYYHSTQVQAACREATEEAQRVNQEENSSSDENMSCNSSSELNAPLLSQNDRLRESRESADNEEGTHITKSVTAYTWQCIRKPTICIFMAYFVTITIFPTWVTKLESTQECLDQESRLKNDLFVPSLIVLFNVFDLFGRIVAGWIDVKNQNSETLDNRIFAATHARLIFLPLFLLLKAARSALVPPIMIFSNDVFPIIFTCLLAFSLGLVACLSFMQVTVRTPPSEDIQHMASTIVNFALGLGFAFASFSSFVYNFVGTGEW